MTVSLSTSGFYDRAAASMASLTKQTATLQTQISGTKKLLAPSDDAAAYRRLAGLSVSRADNGVYAANTTMAQGIAQQSDSTLSSMTTTLQQASEWAVQAANGTLSTEAKAALATQLRGALADIVGLANTTDTRGVPLMGGSGEGAAVTVAADGTLVFADGRPSAIPIGEGQTIDPGVAAKDILKLAGGRDLAQVLGQMADALDAGKTPDPALQTDLASISSQATLAQASLGARMARLDLQAGYLQQSATDNEATRSAIEDTDVTQAITDLQKTMTILSATQASFSKLSGLSLFSYLR